MRNVTIVFLAVAVALGLQSFAADVVVAPISSGSSPHVQLDSGKLAPVNVVMTTNGSGGLIPVGSGGGGGVPAEALPPSTPAVQAFGDFSLGNGSTDGDTFTLTVGPHSETLTYKTTPVDPNDIQSGPSELGDTITRLEELFTPAEIVPSMEAPEVIRITAGTDYPGAAGNSDITLAVTGVEFTLSNTGPMGELLDGADAIVGKLASLAKQPTIGTAGAPSADVLTVQGAPGMAPVVVETGLRSNSPGANFDAPGTGVAIGSATSGMKHYSIRVKSNGPGVATAWDVRLECSIGDDESIEADYAQVIAHTQADLDGTIKANPTPFPCRFIRARVHSLTLGTATDLTVNILGMP